MKIGYFGDEFSHTYACAKEQFSAETLIGYPTVSKAIEAVEKGVIDGAVLPIENSVGGAVADTLDALNRYEVFVNAQYTCPISQSLISFEGAKKENLKRIYSHPQALAQCEDYIKANCPKAKVYPVGNTSEALQIIRTCEEGAIARAPLDNQVTLEEDIEDNKQNATKFVLVKRSPSFDGDTVSIIFDVRHRPGALLNLLGVLAEFNLNMNKIESRPTRDGFKYWFYVEFRCDGGKDKLMEVLSRLSEHAERIKFVGFY